MVGHDKFKQLSDILGDEEIVKKLNPKFNELSLDIREVQQYSKDPVFLAMLLFKLAEERNKTNKMLNQIFDKFDAIMLKLKTEPAPLQKERPLPGKGPASVLPEPDQIILHLAQINSQITAEEVRAELGYKGKNAASQRLNRLFREGHLRKVQSGRKVIYLANMT